MDLELTEAEAALRLRAREVLDRHASRERVRAAEPLGFDPHLWKELVGAGFIGGDRLVEMALVAEEVGRHMAPAPVAEVSVARRLLGRAGVEMPPEDRIVTLALHQFTGSTPQLVPAGAVADAFIAFTNDELVLSSFCGPQVHVPNMGCLPLAYCVVEDTAQNIGSGDTARRHYDSALDEWRVLTASALVGLAQAALEMTVDRVKSRHQFGVPIGSFQSVQHRLADLATDVDGSRLLVWEAAWSTDVGDFRAGELAAMAYLGAARTALVVVKDSLHFHGGYGYTMEHDIQLLFRRAKGWALVLGDPEVELARLGDLLYGAGG
jgi:alkylation response protein AidB-like acyl-CoA dehydrogenase